jgi:hypothetical protein
MALLTTYRVHTYSPPDTDTDLPCRNPRNNIHLRLRSRAKDTRTALIKSGTLALFNIIPDIGQISPGGQIEGPEEKTASRIAAAWVGCRTIQSHRAKSRVLRER